MAAVSAFPKHLERNWFREKMEEDRDFIIIFFLGYLLVITFFGVMGSLQWREMTLEDAQKHLDKLYSVKTTPTTFARRQAMQAGKKEEETKTVDEGRQAETRGRTEEKKVLSAEERRARREAAAGAMSAQIGSAIDAASSVGIFRRAGAGGGGKGGRGAGAVAGLSTGAGSGADMKGLAGLGVSGQDLENAQRLRGSGSLIEGGGGTGGRLNLRDMKPEEIEALIKRASVKAVGAPVVAGSEKAKVAKGRTTEDLSRQISSYSNQVKACFQQFLRQDPNLAGTVRLSFTIKPNGTTSAVRVNESNWNDMSLGNRVNACIVQRAQSWKFEQIEATSGDLTVNYTYVFSR